jgi:methylenetetrahydrofolate dehydrogenase (NADP+)/methenyltetrahydrofolate cyclohydrolase
LVAVVGGRGFVGNGVVRLLEDSKIKCLTLDLGDDLRRTLDADLVVSATGVPEILSETHLKPEHRLVVDAGFIPIANKIILGDVKRSAYSIPQNITPVPGGVGPLQMAILLERLIKITLEINAPQWNLLVE